MLNLLIKSLFALAVLIVFVAGVVFDAKFLSQDQFSDKELKFSRTIDESVEFIPDRFSANINIESTNSLRTKAQISTDELGIITATLDKALNLAKNSQICKASTYSIEPNYSYNDGARIISGQLVNFNIKCEFAKNDINKYEGLIKALNEVVKSSEFIAINLPAIAQSSSPTTISQNNEILHNKILNNAIAKAQYYSKELNRNCLLNSLDFSSAIRPVAYTNLKSTPIESKQNQTLSAIATYSCK